MQMKDYASAVVLELTRTMQTISDEELTDLTAKIISAQKVFVAGAGRSGLMAKAFAMRLMHLGIHAYVVGESVTPQFSEGDLLIVGSGSGETKSLVAMAEKAKSLRGSVALVTTASTSSIGRLSDVVIHIHAQAKQETGDGSTTIQPMGSLFEQSLLILYDSLVLGLMEQRNETTQTMFARHANLE
ncbi:6-phospho-3-hexuloisomerase [Alicyclobacillus dauci]|uniref:6-phospho-3-hexuloisomerase n=1 Tax=Alicyclobacillus dauci TaxID=1475485 RepID=A0ABY6Z1P8_9BACL|nr:6-phospho-3-hexuloisomerase [Alicyclobacillus dauci]WAH36276.1 6-phospho-3-hexuloisomerase [Alicyclobacillus dauci]WAH39403.1 6-phospho-3-hexuloisomerase [Alicyclobacillus dauci]